MPPQRGTCLQLLAGCHMPLLPSSYLLPGSCQVSSQLGNIFLKKMPDQHCWGWAAKHHNQVCCSQCKVIPADALLCAYRGSIQLPKPLGFGGLLTRELGPGVGNPTKKAGIRCGQPTRERLFHSTTHHIYHCATQVLGMQIASTEGVVSELLHVPDFAEYSFVCASRMACPERY